MRPRRSLYAQLALVLLAVLVLVGAGWVTAAVLTTRHYQEEVEQRLNRDLARQLLQDTDLLERGLETGSLAPAPDGAVPPSLEHIFHVLMVVNPRIEVYLLAPDGRIAAYSAPEGRVVRRRVDLAPVERFLAGEERLPIRGDDPRSAAGRKIFSAAAIPARGHGEDPPAGYLYVVLGGEQYESVVARLRSSFVLRLAAGVAAGALVVALVAGLLLFRRLTRRLAALDERIRAFRPAGEPQAAGVAGTEAAPARRGDEIDRLEGAFERMRERIERQVGELAALDEMRRELVANVSHDLRTPLAALRGYLETLQLKNGELEPDERRAYLDVALRHGEQLSDLVERLFELARLDVEEAQLRLEAVSLAELAQDVVQKFDLDAQRLGVALQAELPRRLPPVRGDIRLLERVLDNLIENALAHTPSGGRVRVEVRETGTGVEVRLADSGAGIPEDELPHVFERFHRGRDPGRRRRPGAGLGLAISHRILELHGTDLEVESTVGRGTTFTFRLPHTRH